MKKICGFGFLMLGLGSFLLSQSLTVTAPAKGDVWKKGTEKTISWQKQGSMNSAVKIRLLDAAESRKIFDISNSTTNDGSFKWRIPATVADGQYRIRVRTVDNKVLDDSEIFTLAGSAGGIQMLPQKLQQLPGIKTDVLAEGNTMYLTPVIKSFALLKSTVAEGENVRLNLDLRGADEAYIKEFVTGKQHPVQPLTRGTFSGVFSFVPTSRGTTRLTLFARNRLGENKKECSLEIVPKPVIDKFVIVNNPMAQGQKPRFLVSFRDAETARLEDADENITVKAFNGVTAFNGEVEGSPLSASRTPYLFRLVVLGKGGLTRASESASVTVRPAESFEKAVIAEFYASPRQVVSPMDQSAFHYRYSRSQTAYIVNLETGIRTPLPISTGEIKGSISLAVPFTSNYKLAVSNQYGTVEKYETVSVKNHPGPVVQAFTARRVGSGYQVQIGYEVWGAVKIEIFRARSTDDSSKVSLFTSSGKEPLKGTLLDDPLYFPVVYELRASYPRGRTDRRFQTIKK